MESACSSTSLHAVQRLAAQFQRKIDAQRCSLESIREENGACWENRSTAVAGVLPADCRREQARPVVACASG